MVAVVPTVATTAKGVHPLARSSAIARARAAGSMRYASSTGIFRNPSWPIPRTIAAFSTDEWVCSEAYIRRRAWPTSPRRRASSPGTASRAAARATRTDDEAVSWMTPKRPAGRPSICRSQSRTTSSSSVAAGELRQSMPFTLKAAESISPRMPGVEEEIAK